MKGLVVQNKGAVENNWSFRLVRLAVLFVEHPRILAIDHPATGGRSPMPRRSTAGLHQPKPVQTG